jgi:hypothetical protein
MIDAVKAYAAAHGIGRDRFEFQMLYGIRRDLQQQLVADGYKVRVYVPFGTAVVPVLHAAARRAPGQRGVRAAGDPAGSPRRRRVVTGSVTLIGCLRQCHER